jgi:hypothetical protein
MAFDLSSHSSQFDSKLDVSKKTILLLFSKYLQIKKNC